MEKNEVMNKIRGNKIAIGVFIMFMPILWSPKQLLASMTRGSM